MRRWFGGKSLDILMHIANICSITHLMGESFRHHAQALVGHESDIEASSNVSTPSMAPDDNEDSVY